MPQTLVIQESFYKALGKEKKLEILNSLGISSAHEFFTKIIEKLNEEFAFLEIGTYRFALTPEDKKGFTNIAVLLREIIFIMRKSSSSLRLSTLNLVM